MPASLRDNPYLMSNTRCNTCTSAMAIHAQSPIPPTAAFGIRIKQGFDKGRGSTGNNGLSRVQNKQPLGASAQALVIHSSKYMV